MYKLKIGQAKYKFKRKIKAEYGKQHRQGICNSSDSIPAEVQQQYQKNSTTMEQDLEIALSSKILKNMKTEDIDEIPQ